MEKNRAEPPRPSGAAPPACLRPPRRMDASLVSTTPQDSRLRNNPPPGDAQAPLAGFVSLEHSEAAANEDDEKLDREEDEDGLLHSEPFPANSLLFPPAMDDGGSSDEPPASSFSFEGGAGSSFACDLSR